MTFDGSLLSVTGSVNIGGSSNSLLSVNNISGPVLGVFSDNTLIIGDNQAPSLYTTKNTSVTASSFTPIYSFATASYTSAHVDYNISNGVNLRAGSLLAVWQGNSITYTDNSTMDLGSTFGFTFSFVISGTYAVLQAISSTSTWIVKTIIRSI